MYDPLTKEYPLQIQLKMLFTVIVSVTDKVALQVNICLELILPVLECDILKVAGIVKCCLS